jgi:hypothetical protein
VVIIDHEESGLPTLYSNVAIVECADQAGLEQLLAAGLRRYLVRRLSDTAAVVDHQRLADVHKLLKRLGETPRVTVE